MITFFVNPETQFTFKGLKKCNPDFSFRTMSYSKLFRQNSLPSGTYIFSDLERLDQWELRIAAEIWRLLDAGGAGFKVLNNPALVKTRYSLLRSLFVNKINQFNVYRVDELAKPENFPVFVRREFDHAYPLTELLDSQKELDQAITDLRANGEPSDGLLITEFAAEPVTENVFRKYGTFRVGTRIFPHCCVHERRWLVKYGQPSAWTKEMEQDEHEFVRNNTHQDLISEVFGLANIDYGRVDFGIVNDRVQIYEINTNPHIAFRLPDGSDIRQKSLEMSKIAFLSALDEIDIEGSEAEAIKLDSELLSFTRSKQGYEQMRTFRR